MLIFSGGALARKIQFIEADQADLPCPVPFAKIFWFSEGANQFIPTAVPSQTSNYAGK
jgi:hypothetical protein